ncbi:sulfatase [Streptomyces sp. SP18CS02]|uniref:sulfatase n=1 Tax=Streptomyces sp. SP18CS02 TaxID=3002531 RepID=UPI002E776572|nr:sulfatase [Streptomyces sp. SP18CS02]MEE1754591.1 sulfatase [Streptomyces sp. SP18CS02]
MSIWIRSRQLPHADTSGTEGDPPPDGTATAATAEAPAGPGAAGPGAVAGGPRGRHPELWRIAGRVNTALAAVLVLGVLLLPNDPARLSPGAFAGIPVEALCGAALILVLRAGARRAVALLAGAVLGALTVLKLLDIGFRSVLARPFDPTLDWVLLGDAEDFLGDSIGRTGALWVVAGAVAGVVVLLVLVAWSVLRLSRLVVRHGAVATRATLVLGTVWVVCAALGVQLSGSPVASRNTAGFVQSRAQQVRAGWEDRKAFARESAVDAFRDTPPERLLTGLRGKDVVFVFIESYGRNAIEDPEMASEVGAVLDDGTRRLGAAGFSSRSAFLTSPTSGGGSWLAHSTFASGLWIHNQQRYGDLTGGDRLTLTSAFRRTDAWRTVGIMPGVTMAWPEGRFYGLDNVYDSRNLGYQGPRFSWSRVPDQFSLSAFERLEHGKKGRDPLMAEIILTSSHHPWAPVPRTVGWDEVGDGSVYDAVKEAGKDPKEVWRDPAQVRAEYRRAIEYSLTSLISYVEKYGDDDTVLVFLGDHQPVPTVTRERYGRDVPIAIVARDPAVLARTSGWGWQDGLKPGPQAPVWRMDSFRDRFLTAYGPR